MKTLILATLLCGSDGTGRGGLADDLDTRLKKQQESDILRRESPSRIRGGGADVALDGGLIMGGTRVVGETIWTAGLWLEGDVFVDTFIGELFLFVQGRYTEYALEIGDLAGDRIEDFSAITVLAGFGGGERISDSMAAQLRAGLGFRSYEDFDTVPVVSLQFGGSWLPGAGALRVEATAVLELALHDKDNFGTTEVEFFYGLQLGAQLRF